MHPHHSLLYRRVYADCGRQFVSLLYDLSKLTLSRQSPSGINSCDVKLYGLVFFLSGGMIGLAIFLLSLKSLVLFVNMNYASHPHAAQKQSVFELVTGNYLAPQYCKVFWEWDEPQSVGKTMAFKIKVRL